MIILYKHLIVFVAIAIGTLLLFFGIRNINLKNKQSNIFWLTLLSVLVFNSCANSQNIKNENSNNMIIEQSDRVIKLNNSLDWQYFKTFWQELDNQVPNAFSTEKNGKMEKFYSYSSNFSDTDEDLYKANIQELNLHIKNLKTTKLLTDNELMVLEIICKERIEFLFTFNSMSISHIMPSKINTNQNQSIDLIENKIDTLNLLLYQSIITKVEYDKTLENLNKEIENFLYITVILQNYKPYIYEGNYQDKNTLENNKAYFEDFFAKQNDKTEYNKIKEKLSLVESTFESIDELFNDLIINKESRILELQKTTAYNDLKKLWIEIDKIEPLDNEYSTSSYEDYNKRGDLRDKIPPLIENLEKTNLLTKSELNLLNMLIDNRIKALQGKNIYTRAYIIESYSPAMIFELEKKIDVLMKLKTDNNIDKKEYEKALSEVFNLSDEVIILSIINNNFMYDKIKEKDKNATGDLIDIYINILDEHFINLTKNNKNSKEFLTSIAENYKTSIEKLQEIKSVLPTIHKLIESFEK
jgi:hypothetical protein